MYSVYNGMIQRCNNPNNNNYHNYGGRGITVCDKWLNSFDLFCKDMGPRPYNKSIDRQDNNGHYEPNNCRWATTREQSLNTRRNHKLTYNGKTLTINEWAKCTGMHEATIRKRLRLDWTAEEALTVAIDKSHSTTKHKSLRR